MKINSMNFTGHLSPNKKPVIKLNKSKKFFSQKQCQPLMSNNKLDYLA